MKILIIAALLAVTAPAFAAEANPKDFPLLLKWRHVDFQCYRGVFPDLDLDVETTKAEFDKSERGKVCVAADKLRKQVIARGYCVFDNDGIGRPSRDGKHCYGVRNLPE